MKNPEECRNKAAALRACSQATSMAEYQAKFEAIAREWERVARLAEMQDRFDETQDADRSEIRYG